MKPTGVIYCCVFVSLCFNTVIAQNNLIPHTSDCSGSRPAFEFNIQ